MEGLKQTIAEQEGHIAELEDDLDAALDETGLDEMDSLREQLELFKKRAGEAELKLQSANAKVGEKSRGGGKETRDRAELRMMYCTPLPIV